MRRVHWSGLLRRGGHLAVAVALGLCTATAASADTEYSEYEVKAAFLVNFAKFTEWPPGALAPDEELVIGVLGPDPFGDGLADLVSGTLVRGHHVRIRGFEGIRDLDTCHVLFVSAGYDAEANGPISEIRYRPVLTVGEAASFLYDGGMIRFFLDAGRIRFDINREATRLAELSISSQVLRLANTVY